MEEDYTRDFVGNITAGSGYTVVSSGDDETIEFESGGYIELETWNFGNEICRIRKDKYQSGYGTITVKYKDGTTEANCDADTWTVYSAQFICSGWVKVRVEAT